VGSNNRNFYLANSAGINWRYYQIVDKVSSAIDYLETVSVADHERLAIYGISMGGATAIMGSVADDRIKVTIASGTNVFTPRDTFLLQHRRFKMAHHYGWNVVQRPTNAELLPALYPNPIIAELNKRDTAGVFSEAVEAATLVKQYYEQRGGMGSKVRIVTFDGQRTPDGHYMEITQVKQVLDEFFISRKL